MSDFLTELRREVAGAHAAHRRRGRLWRLTHALWQPGPLLGAAAAAVALLALVIGVRSLRAPEPAGGPRVISVVTVGGNPVDGTFTDGSLWLADFRGRAVLRVDPSRRRVRSRIPLAGEPGSIAAGAGGLWVRTWREGPDRRTDVSRVDPVTERIVTRAASGFGTALAVGADAAWAARTEVPPEGIDRIDARSGDRTRLADVPHLYSLAAAGDALWALGGDGTVDEIDASTRRVRQRWPLVDVSNPLVENENSLVSDDRGAWVLAAGTGVRTMLVRIEGGEVTRRFPVDATVLPAITVAFGDVWVATRPDPRGPYRLSRLDPATGTTAGSVAIGSHRPAALVPAGDSLCVVGSDGTVVIVDPGSD